MSRFSFEKRAFLTEEIEIHVLFLFFRNLFDGGSGSRWCGATGSGSRGSASEGRRISQEGLNKLKKKLNTHLN